MTTRNQMVADGVVTRPDSSPRLLMSAARVGSGFMLVDMKAARMRVA